jgi:hypothetical protein
MAPPGAFIQGLVGGAGDLIGRRVRKSCRLVPRPIGGMGGIIRCLVGGPCAFIGRLRGRLMVCRVSWF